MRFGRWLLTLFLAVDVVDTIAWLGNVVPDARSLDWLALTLVAARGLVGSIEGMALWAIVRREPPARVLAIAGLAGAAILTTLIAGCGLAPSDIPPGTAAIVVAAYWVAMILGAGLLLLSRDETRLQN